MNDAPRATGKVKWFSMSKGYGFIVPNNGGDDVFCHANELRGCTQLTVDQVVTFELASNAKKGNGRAARSVRQQA